jgi:hypothetical protein
MNPITNPIIPIMIQLGDPSGLKAPRINRKENMIKIPAVIKAMILPARISPPFF